jgi:transposase
MIQITPQMRILVAVEPVDFRCGIDGLAQLCRQRLQEDPFSGTVFVFRNRRGTALKALVYDGQGYWLCQKRLSSGRFHWWPVGGQAGEAARKLAAHQLHVLFSAGNPEGTRAAPDWRPVSPKC